MRRNTTGAAHLWQVVIATATATLALGAAAARADTMVDSMNQPTADFTTPADPALASVGVDEKLGARVPLDLRFRDQDGHEVALRDLIKNDVPVLLTFNYSNCPMLCSLQLNGLVGALPHLLPFAAGRQFRILSIDIEPKETPATADKTRAKYLDRLEADSSLPIRGSAEAGGWTFLVAAHDGDDTAIRALADAVGVHYHYVDQTGDWAHPAVLVFLSPSGVVTRYIHGTQFDPDDLTASITRAGMAEPSGAIGFVERCFHYDPGANSAARTGQNLMKLTAATFAAIVFAALFLAHWMRRHGRRPALAHRESLPDEDHRP